MKALMVLGIALCLGGDLMAQDASSVDSIQFDEAAGSIDEKLEQSIAELSALRSVMATEKVALSRTLSELEGELSEVRIESQNTLRKLDRSTLDLSNIRTEIKSRQDESSYLTNLFGEYLRNFEARLHIVEVDRYEDVIAAASSAAEGGTQSELQVFEKQTRLLSASLGRLQEALGGVRFAGSAVDSEGILKEGTFVLVGPFAIFKSDDSELAGTAEQRLGSLEPAQIDYSNPLDASVGGELVAAGVGFLPFDPSLGNAHKFEATEETWIEHVQRGGDIMIPIFVMASLALLVALYKWLGLAFRRKPSRKRLNAVLDAVEERDEDAAREAVELVPGFTGKMLAVGVAHLGEPRELIEEVMYEKVLVTKLKLQSMLPFIAICAASAPLLGLLGTVTGIINTFKLITVFGSGDVKTLSGGISEALITTEYGLIVAIPALLLHSFLSRKARAIVTRMETAAVAFSNQVSKAYGYTSEDLTRSLSSGAAPMDVGSGQSGAVSALDDKVASLSRECRRVTEMLDAGSQELFALRKQIESVSGGAGSTGVDEKS